MARQYKDTDTQRDIADAGAEALKAYLFANHDTLTLAEVTKMASAVRDGVWAELRNVESDLFREAIQASHKEETA